MNKSPVATCEPHGNHAPLRRALLAIFLMGVLGCAAELLLLEHVEGGWQLLPLVLFGLSALVLIGQALLPSAIGIRAFQLTMILFLISGITGIFLHYQAKAVFAREMDPSLSGMNLIREALRGQMPPVLAPGMMMQLGLLGLAWTWRHPATIKVSQPTHSGG
jgi:hypothetical protein